MGLRRPEAAVLEAAGLTFILPRPKQFLQTRSSFSLNTVASSILLLHTDDEDASPQGRCYLDDRLFVLIQQTNNSSMDTTQVNAALREQIQRLEATIRARRIQLGLVQPAWVKEDVSVAFAELF